MRVICVFCPAAFEIGFPSFSYEKRIQQLTDLETKLQVCCSYLCGWGRMFRELDCLGRVFAIAAAVHPLAEKLRCGRSGA